MSYPRTNMDSYTIRPINRSEADHLIESHYLKRWPGVTILILGMFKNSYSDSDGTINSSEYLVGVIVYALPPIQTNKRYKVKLSWELARLFILDSEPFNSETWLIAKSVKWIKAHRPDVEFLVSYADPSVGHSGTIYKAANWKADGRTDDERKSPRCDYKVGNKMYSRRSHIPEGVLWERVPRVSKYRFTYKLNNRKLP